MSAGQHEKALHKARAARRLFKEAFDKVAELQMLNLFAQANILRLDKASQRASTSGWSDALKASLEGVKMAREIGDKDSLGYAQLNVAQCHRATGRFEDGLEAAWEAVMVYRELGNPNAECTA